MPIEPYLVLSTGHLTEESRDLVTEAAIQTLLGDVSILTSFELRDKDRQFSEIAKQITCLPHAYGWYAYAHDDLVLLREIKVPENLIDLYAYARSKQCAWLNFDRDADVEEGLPTYDW